MCDTHQKKQVVRESSRSESEKKY